MFLLCFQLVTARAKRAIGPIAIKYVCILLTKAVPIFGNQLLPTEGQAEHTPQYLGGLTRLAF